MDDKIKEVMGLVLNACDASEYQQFNKAYELRQAIESKLRELVTAWIDVNKEKPEDEQQVWVLCVDSNGKSTFQAYAIWADGDWFLDLQDSGDLYSRKQAIKDGLDACTVTHWMPLPKDPS